MQIFLEKNKKILVTGYTGFIGKPVTLELLKKRFLIYGINKSNKKIKNTKKIKTKINSEKFNKILNKEKFKLLIHIAWETNTFNLRNSKRNKEWYNLSVKLIDNFFKCGGQKVICLGSSDEYYRKINTTKVFYEYSMKNKENLYAKYKIKLYNYLKKKYSKKYLWLRVFWLFGKNENERRLLPKLISAKKNRKKLLIKNPNFSLDYLNVEVAAKIIVRLIQKNLHGCFNVASGKSIKISEICKLIDPKLKYYKFKKGNNYLNIVGSVSKLRKYNSFYNYNILNDSFFKV